MPTKGCHVVRGDLLKNWRSWQEGRFNIDLKADPKKVLMDIKGSVPLFILKKRGYLKDVVLHGDRGIEYTNHRFQALLKKHNFKHSVNRPGHCTESAYMESFFHSLKGEIIRGTLYKSLESLRKSLSRYINQFYNMVRLHSGINYLSPIEFEKSIA